MTNLKTAEEIRQEFKKEFWGKAIDWRATDKDIKQICDFWFKFIAQHDTTIRTEILEALEGEKIQKRDTDGVVYFPVFVAGKTDDTPVRSYNNGIRDSVELVKNILK